MGETPPQLLLYCSNLLLSPCFSLPQLLKLYVFLCVLLLQQSHEVCFLLSLSFILSLQLSVELIDNSLDPQLTVCDLLLCLLPLQTDLLYSGLLA